MCFAMFVSAVIDPRQRFHITYSGGFYHKSVCSMLFNMSEG